MPKKAIDPICSIANCGKRHKARGWCGAHYRKWRLKGSAEHGRTNGAPKQFYADVVLTYEGDECLIWPFCTSGDGYGSIQEKDKTRSQIVARRVCEDVYGPPPSPRHQAAHSCGRGDLACVAKSHLSWKTPSDNCADKIAHGTTNRGERAPSAKLTRADVLQIRELRKTLSGKTVAEKFGISMTQVYSISRGEKWAWLNG